MNFEQTEQLLQKYPAHQLYKTDGHNLTLESDTDHTIYLGNSQQAPKNTEYLLSLNTELLPLHLIRDGIVFHVDSGHGWLEVNKAYAEDVMLSQNKTISHYSYQKEASVFLEEDRDATLFCTVYQTLFGEEAWALIDIDHTYTDGNSQIRNYQPYKES